MGLTLPRVLALALLARISVAQRTVVIENRCEYTVWPAVSGFPDLDETYSGEPGWESKAGSKASITIPSKWMGRIWGRRGCMTRPDGYLICVAGGCEGGLDCGESVISESTALELRLESSTNGQYDVYDLQNGGGWSVPTAVKPQVKKCEPVSCTPNLEDCPKEEMKLKDSYGEVLGCSSACFAHIGDSAQQCCTGDYGDSSKCKPEQIIGYEYFKTPCKSSYAYFQDRSTTTVDMLCPSEGDPGFTLTFCPDGDGGKSNSTAEAGESGAGTKSGASAATQGDGQPTGTGQAKPTDIPALSSVQTVANATETNGSSPAHETSSGGSSTLSSSSKTSSSSAEDGDATAASSEETSDGSSGSSDEGEIAGMSVPVFVSVIGGIVVVGALALLGICLCVKKKGRTQTRGVAEEGGPGQGQGREMNNNTAQNALGHRRSSKRRALLAQQSSGSEFSSESSDEEKVPARRASTRSSRSSRK